MGDLPISKGKPLTFPLMIETRLSDVLHEDSIALDFSAPSIPEAVRVLMEPVFRRAGIPPERQRAILEAIHERERCASTVSPPVALPHTRSPEVDRIIAALAINRSGVGQDNPGVQFLLPFVSPEKATAEHLRFLAGVAKLFRMREAVDGLLAARSAAEVLEVLRRLGN
jgi:mannitol/fructose-specific phosphotransferase system IIA component (Ntr-type)